MKREPIKFIKPKLKTKRFDKIGGYYTMSLNEYDEITRPEKIKFRTGFTSIKYLPQPIYLLDTKMTKYISLYSGKVKGKKANGWGIELLIGPGWDQTTIEEYYEGEWKNGKRDGYGECYDHHPLIGYATEFDPSKGRKKMTFSEKEGYSYYSKTLKIKVKVYKGFWKNGKKVSK
tara:strand:- start:49 stop:570 length:522 start_codon:yes stop_codon:yes gene_type:complete